MGGCQWQFNSQLSTIEQLAQYKSVMRPEFCTYPIAMKTQALPLAIFIYLFIDYLFIYLFIYLSIYLFIGARWGGWGSQSPPHHVALLGPLDI